MRWKLSYLPFTKLLGVVVCYRELGTFSFLAVSSCGMMGMCKAKWC